MLKKRDKDNEYINERFQRPGLTESEIEEIKYAFRLFDEKGHGVIKSNEILTATQTLGFDTRHEKLYGLISNYAATEEYITFKEFLDLISKGVNEKMSREDVDRVFEVFDEDRKGKISLSNLRRVAKELGETLTELELADMIGKGDLDGDGEITADELYSIITKQFIT